MASWLKKRKLQEEKETDKKEKKEKKSSDITKRLDKLRAYLSCDALVQSLGSEHSYLLKTGDLSLSGIFLQCQDTSLYPFQEKQTLVDVKLTLDSVESPGSMVNVEFMAKVVRVLEKNKETGDSAGYGLKIIQIPFESRKILEAVVLKYGKEEASPPMAQSA
jgi:arginyl-tRNA synthetase